MTILTNETVAVHADYSEITVADFEVIYINSNDEYDDSETEPQ